MSLKTFKVPYYFNSKCYVRIQITFHDPQKIVTFEFMNNKQIILEVDLVALEAEMAA